MTATALPAPPRWQQPRLLQRLFSDPVPVLDELSDRIGPNVRFGAGPVRIAIIGDPKVLRELLHLPTDNFRWGHKFNVLGFVVGKQSLLVSDGDDHARRRSAVQSAFSRRRLNGWIPMIVERTDRVIDELVDHLAGAEREVDLYPLGKGLMVEIVVRSSFGEVLGRRSKEIGELFERSQAYLEGPFVRQLPNPLPGSARARVRADRVVLHAMLDERITELRRSPTQDPLDVLAAMVADGTLTDAEIRDQVVTLIGAGFDTSSSTLAWMCWCVSGEPGLWQRLRDEADAVLGPLESPAAPDAETLQRLELAHRVVRETTRLHPAGVVAPREAARDIAVGGFRVPKGTLILWSAYLAGRDPLVWTDPLRFDPDRFLRDRGNDEQRALADLAWVPFGGGPRNCIGFALAQMELTLIVARFAQRLDISSTSPQIPRPIGLVVNRPAGGAPMRVSARR